MAIGLGLFQVESSAASQVPSLDAAFINICWLRRIHTYTIRRAHTRSIGVCSGDLRLISSSPSTCAVGWPKASYAEAATLSSSLHSIYATDIVCHNVLKIIQETQKASVIEFIQFCENQTTSWMWWWNVDSSSQERSYRVESTGSDVWQHGGIRAEGTDAGTGGDAGFCPRIWRVPGCHIPAVGL